tara:strand:+ start:8298 stop:8483 length:186 start_codon:yes stop_codon:yes gene_type:complete
MRENKSETINDVNLVCPNCNHSNLKWNEVYYKENEQLIKPEKLLLSWCPNCSSYFLNDKNS